MNGQVCTSAILLAAGGSTRLGRPKQLLPWNGSTLLGLTIKHLAMAGCERIIVVVGASEPQVREHCVSPLSVHLEIVTNIHWSRGQATSLCAGIECVLAGNEIGPTVIALCDQPLIDSTHYRDLVASVSSLRYFAAATEYPEGLGVPACFSRSALQSLSVASGDSGAKCWLRAQPLHTVGRVACPAAATDVDTEIDYQELNARSGPIK